MNVSPKWAVLSGVVGLVANVLLILFFAVSDPWRSGGSLDWLGPANDMTVLVQFAALVPVALAVRDRLAGEVARVVTAVAVGAMAAIVFLQLALLSGLLAFEVQVWPVVVCLSITFGWVLVVSRAGRGALPRAVVGLGTTVGATYLAGAAVFAIGVLLLPPDSVALYVVCGAGVVVGLVGWLAFPVWPLVLARRGLEARL